MTDKLTPEEKAIQEYTEKRIAEGDTQDRIEAPSLREQVDIYVDAFLRRIGWKTAISAQQQAALDAFAMKAGNAARGKFEPTHPTGAKRARSLPITLRPMLFTVCPKFPYNPMVIEHGLDRRVYNSLARGIAYKLRATPEKIQDAIGDELTRIAVAWASQKQKEAAALQTSGSGRMIWTWPAEMPRTLRIWQEFMRQQIARAATAAQAQAKEKPT